MTESRISARTIARKRDSGLSRSRYALPALSSGEQACVPCQGLAVDPHGGLGSVLAATALLAGVAASPGQPGQTNDVRLFGPVIEHDGTSGDPPISTALGGSAGLDRQSVERLLSSYDELYADIVGNRDVLYDSGAEAHRRIAALLTEASPLAPTRVYGGAPDLGDPGALRANQVPGRTPGGRSSVLGDRAAELPIVHELLSFPDQPGDVMTVPVCVHLDWIIRPAGERPPWIQSITDAEIDGEVTVRRTGEGWHLHDWRLTGQLFGPDPDDRCGGRCGPDPAGMAVRDIRWGPTGRDEDRDGYEDWANGPSPTDPPCDQ